MMDRIFPHNFTTNADINGQSTLFEFTSMNIKVLQLFQVYFSLPDQKQRIRFHMQKDKDGQFRVTDKHRLPAGIEIPEQQLAAAIINEHPGL
ncbi:hypothetical protein [Chitinophaga rhizophila]|uniref:Uncharacterized protein n=1 Tax=Chitinophaga rhizophila TaxID=2866212 RepID=A0ABS7G7D4_9BACT|nr:hypothetical protein [Chitinophaga rhizophila]MBW8683045.1 hypothetical protein [Chitinophaga rhizophila]